MAAEVGVLGVGVGDLEARSKEVVEAVGVVGVDGGEDVGGIVLASVGDGVVDEATMEAVAAGVGVDDDHVEGDGRGRFEVEVCG